MLKQIDRYIIKKYLGTFFFAMILITLVSIVIHLAEKIQKFLNPELTSSEIIHYFLDYIPWINGIIFPLFSLIAVIFFTTRMARDSEIISMLSAGVSFRRIMWPYILAASFIAAIHYYGNHYIIPNSNIEKEEFELKYFSSKGLKTNNNNLHFFLDKQSKIFIRYYRKSDTIAQNFRLEKFDEQGKINYILKARKIKMLDSLRNWRLEDYQKRTIKGLQEQIIKGKKGEHMDTTFNFGPEDFIKFAKEKEMMTSDKLVAYIEKEKKRGLGNTKPYETELYRRSAQPFSIIILSIIGLAVAGRKSRGSMGLNLAKGVIIGAAFVFMTQFATAFSENLEISPMLGMWFPNIIFGVISIYLVMTAQK